MHITKRSAVLACLCAVALLAGCATLPHWVPIPHQGTVDASNSDKPQPAVHAHVRGGPTPPAQQVINTGTSPNDGTGDPLRTAFTKDNANATALFSMFGTGANLYSSGSALATDIAALFTSCGPSTPALGYLGACVAGGGGGGPSGATNTVACNNTGSSGPLTACTPQNTIGVLDSPAANAQTGTSYTFVLGDANGMVTMSNTSANVVCVPQNASVAFAINTVLVVEDINTGVTTIAPAGQSGCGGGPVSLQSAQYGLSSSQTYSLGGQYGFAVLQQTATDVWQVLQWNTPVISARSGGSMTIGGTCTVSSSTLSGTSGSITMGGAGGCTIILTVVGAPPAGHGIVGTMGDTNQPTLPTWRATSSTSTTVTFSVPAAVASSDVLTVGPLGWY
jgi:hypothetical protein